MARFLNRRFPLAISWYLTYQCNYNCKYCAIPSRYTGDEIKTSDIFSIIDRLSKIGTMIISFCGGEPLLRDDIGEIINYCRSRDIKVSLISNGELVPKKIKFLKNVNALRLSFDGPFFIHDKLRGRGAYEKVIKAVSIAKENKIKVIFNTTLTRINLPHIEFILAKSRELGVPIKFSPLKYIHSGDKDIDELILPTPIYKEKIKYLLHEARRNKLIMNSLSSLQYIYCYPEGKEFRKCIGGRIFCHIKPNGDMHPCEVIIPKDAPNCLRDGVRRGFNALPLNSCSQCWCTGTLELNMIYSFKISALIKVIRENI